MKIVLTAKSIIILLFCFILVGFAIFVAIFVGDFFSEKPAIVSPEAGENIVQGRGCVFSEEEKIVKGNSLSGLIEDGETVRALFGYYDCNEIKREDVILYSYAGSENPLIKIVRGIPGDTFNLQRTDGGWYILINGEILKNSKNEPYLLDQRSYNMLSLYEKDYQGVIPEQAYLIMGNLTSGATDSTRYGLVHKNDILGKAIRQ